MKRRNFLGKGAMTAAGLAMPRSGSMSTPLMADQRIPGENGVQTPSVSSTESLAEALQGSFSYDTRGGNTRELAMASIAHPAQLAESMRPIFQAKIVNIELLGFHGKIE